MANALIKTIANCKNFVFLNTTNSIIAESIVENTAEINSPWLYFEINVANALLPKTITETRNNFSRSQENLLEMAFEAELKKFEKVSIKEFLKIVEVNRNNKLWILK